MRTLQDIYKLYLQSIKGEKEDMDNIDVTKKEIEILKKAQQTIKPKMYLIKKEEPKIGNIYMFNNLYFIISDDTEYPYEVFVCSNFYELATDEDIIVSGKSKDIWVIENLVRYVDDSILKESVHIDDIDTKFINIMKDNIYRELPLPKNMVGLKANKDSIQEKFKSHEIQRSLILTVESLLEEDTIQESVTINIKGTAAQENILKAFSNQLAASSYDSFLKTNLGDMLLKEDGTVTLRFDKDYTGLLARLYLNKIEIFYGFLPKKLNIKTDINKLEILKENLEIEFL